MNNLDRQPSSAVGPMPAAATGRTAAGQEPNTAADQRNLTVSHWGLVDDHANFFAWYENEADARAAFKQCENEEADQWTGLAGFNKDGRVVVAEQYDPKEGSDGADV